MFLLSACASLAAGATAPTRPSMLTGAAPGDVVHYFGVGSNMLRSKIVSRGINGSSIEVLEMRPALVRGHRLAFNMRGFPPLEPGMGGIEESPSEECHGALCTMTAENYEKLWQSEGGAMPNPGYEEIVVEAEGYGLPQRVRAVALRARPHVRLRRDADPSQRYMRMLVDGAKELGLSSSYVAKLEAITTQRATGVLRMLAVQHLFFATLLIRPRLRWAGRAISAMLWVGTCRARTRPRCGATRATRASRCCCCPPRSAPVRVGMWATGKEIPPMMKAVMQPPRAEPDAAECVIETPFFVSKLFQSATRCPGSDGTSSAAPVRRTCRCPRSSEARHGLVAVAVPDRPSSRCSLPTSCPGTLSA